jgi:DNA-binding CsgD family transcriptional regulator
MCKTVGINVGRIRVRRVFGNAPSTGELIQELEGIVGEAVALSLRRCAEIYEFSACFVQKLYDLISKQFGAGVKQWENRVYVEQLEKAGVRLDASGVAIQVEMFDEGGQQSSLEELIERELPSMVISLSTELPDKQAETMRLWLEHDMTTYEIAAYMNIEEPTVRVHKHRACGTIKKLIKKRYRDEFPSRRR